MRQTETPVFVANRAKGSSFYAAMRILPRDQREPMYAIYNICRAIDDIADERCSPQKRLSEIANWRRDLDVLYAGGPPGRFVTVASTVRRFDLKHADFAALLDGMAMDAEGDVRAPDMATLDLYCDRVASAVGRLSNQIFGIRGVDGLLLAHHLGRALQLTNILRDLDEDADLGRLYLPREALAEANIASCVPNEVMSHPSIARACQPIVAKAHSHFRDAETVWHRIPRVKTRAPRLMGAVYARLLARLETRGFQPPRSRIKLNRLELISLVVRNGLF